MPLESFFEKEERSSDERAETLTANKKKAVFNGKYGVLLKSCVHCNR